MQHSMRGAVGMNQGQGHQGPAMQQQLPHPPHPHQQMHPHPHGVHPHQHVESLISTPTFSAGDYDDHQGHGPVGVGGMSMMGMSMMGMSAGGSPGKARIRRSENELRQAADCVVKGSTFQTVSDRFGIPISTIRFYMARRGILPQRRRGRSSASTAMVNPFHQIP